jgi:hypothetical protein
MLSTLRIAGLRHLPGLERILDDDNEIGAIGAVIVQAPGDPTPHTLLNARGQLDEVGLDGSGERSLTTTSPCAGTPAATPDGQWGACLSNDTHGYADQVEIVSLAAGTSQHDEVRLISGFYFGMVWSPDDTQLALVAEQEQDRVSPCAVQIYRAGMDHRTLALTTTFTSDVFASYGACEVLGVGWSPDGTQLEIAVKSSDGLLVDEHVAVTSSLLAANDSSVIPGGQFVSAPIGTPFDVSDSAWNPQSGTLALISDSTQADGKTLRYYPTPAGQVGAWFVISDSQHTLQRLAWSPDGRQLLLIVGGPSCVDNCGGFALPDVYFYTPPTP